MPSRAEVMARVGRLLAEGITECMQADPREAAVKAFIPGGPPVHEIEAMIRRFHAQSERVAA